MQQRAAAGAHGRPANSRRRSTRSSTRCLQPDPAHRYQTSAELLRDARAGRRRAASDGTSSRRRPRTGDGAARRRRAAVAWRSPPAVVAVVLLGIVRLRDCASAISDRIGRRRARRPGRPDRDLAGRAAVPQRLGRPVAGLARHQPQRGAAHRSRRVAARPDDSAGAPAPGARRPADRRERERSTPADLARIADFASARQRALGAIHRSSATRSASTPRCRIWTQRSAIPLKATAPNRQRLLGRGRRARRSRRRQTSRRGSTRRAERAQGDGLAPSTQSFDALAALQRGRAARARGQPSGGAEAVRGGHRRRTRASRWPTRRWPRPTRASATTRRRTQFSRRAVALSESLPPQEKYLIAAAHYRSPTTPTRRSRPTRSC